MARSIPVGGIHISITGNSAEFRGAAKAARAEIFKLKAEFAKMRAAANTAGLAILAAAGGIVILGKNLADGIDNLGKLSTSLRTSVKDLQALEDAAMLQGVAWKQVEKGLVNLRNVIGEIASGDAYKTQTDAWERLNIPIEEFIHLNAADQVALLGKRMMETVPQAEQLSVMAELVGKKAALGFLRMATEVESSQKRLEEFGLALTDRAADDVEAANDSLALLGSAFKNVGRQITAQAAPGITKWARGVMDSLRPGAQLRNIVDSLTAAFSRVVGVVGEFIKLAGPFINEGTLMAAAIYLCRDAIHPDGEFDLQRGEEHVGAGRGFEGGDHIGGSRRTGGGGRPSGNGPRRGGRAGGDDRAGDGGLQGIPRRDFAGG